ncbi:MAG: efflux RND transporter periplasmic adaptor subunit [Smithella sp.]
MDNLGMHKRIVLGAAMVLAILMTACCQGKSDKSEVKRPAVSGVTVVAVTKAVVDEIVETTGIVRSDRTSMVASRAMGVVNSILVREGDSVTAGQLLLTIDDRDTAQRVKGAAMTVEAAKQNRDLAEKTWKRYKNLYEDNALTRQEMDQVETQKKVAVAEYERSKAMAEEARTYQTYTRVTAPVSGRVTEKRIEVGSMAFPGMPLLVIEGGGGFHIEAAVDESLQNRVKTGMAVEVTIDTLNRLYTGRVREVIPAVDPLSRTFKIKVKIQENLPQSGLFARVRIPVSKKEAILVPESVIVRKGQLTGVYTVDNQGVIAYRLIRSGISHAAGTEILSGLSVQDRIIVQGIERAVDGGVISGGPAK